MNIDCRRAFCSQVFGILLLAPISVCGEEQHNLKSDEQPAYLGKGEHSPSNLVDWQGQPSVVTRLKKEEKTYIFERRTKNEFIVKDKHSGEEYLKLVNENPKNLWPEDYMILLDIQVEQECVTALFYSVSGFTWARARLASYCLKPPFHWKPKHSTATKRWMVESVMVLRPELSSGEIWVAGANPKNLKQVHLNQNGEIQFEYEGFTDIYSFVALPQNEIDEIKKFKPHCKRNGKIYTKALCITPGIKIENHILESYRNSKKMPKIDVATSFSSHDDAIRWYRQNFQDKQAAEEIIGIISKAYSDKNSK